MERKEWFSSKEIAEVLGISIQATIKNLKREAIPSRPRAGRGGGREYHISSLPQETQLALAAKQVSAKAASGPATPEESAGKAEAMMLALRDKVADLARSNRRIESLAVAAGLTGKPRDRMNAKLEILKRLGLFQKESGLGKSKSRDEFARAYNLRLIQVEDWVRETIPDLTPITIFRWEKTVSETGIAALAGNYGKKAVPPKVEAEREIEEFVLAMIHDRPNVKATDIHAALDARFGRTAHLPSLRGLQRWLQIWKTRNAALYLHLCNPDRARGKYAPAVGSASESIVRINQLWEMDSTPGDVMLQGNRRATIVGVIDVKTRRGMLLVCPTGKSIHVAALIRRAIILWGVPEAIKTDNGSDYTSRFIETALQALEIEHPLCPPFSPQKKPFIERFLGNMSHGLMELLPNFIGHNVAERKDIEEQRTFANRLMKRGETVELNMTPEELQTFLDDWTEAIYHHRPHDGLDGKTPALVSAGLAVRRISPDQFRALDWLLSENQEIRVVTKGKISIDNAVYTDDLNGGGVLATIPGERVRVLRDKTDLGHLSVYAMDGTFLCVAVCPDLVGVDRSALAAEARAIYNKRLGELREQLRKLSRSYNLDNIAQEILDRAKEKARILTPLPGPVETVTVPALESATEALAAIGRAQEERALLPPPVTAVAPAEPVTAQTHAKVIQLFRKERQEAQIDEDAQAREAFFRWLKMKESGFAGLSVEEQVWRRSYEESNEFKGRLMVYESFGRVS